MSDIEEAAPENSLIDLSDNEIEIKIEKVLIRDFPEDEVFFRAFYRDLTLLHLRVLLLPFIVCCKINILDLLKMVKI